jgi:hypothetical protein
MEIQNIRFLEWAKETVDQSIQEEDFEMAHAVIDDMYEAGFVQPAVRLLKDVAAAERKAQLV